MAAWLLAQYIRGDLQVEAEKYLNAELDVNSTEEALAGAMDIIAETIADDAVLRKRIREETFRIADVVAAAVAKKAKERSPFEMYYDYSEPVRKDSTASDLSSESWRKKRSFYL